MNNVLEIELSALEASACSPTEFAMDYTIREKFPNPNLPTLWDPEHES